MPGTRDKSLEYIEKAAKQRLVCDTIGQHADHCVCTRRSLYRQVHQILFSYSSIVIFASQGVFIPIL